MTTNNNSKGWKPQLIQQARKFRKEATPAEAALWKELRRGKIDGFLFRRQHPISRFIVDFYCSKVHLIIEIDGPVHDLQQERDKEREKHLESLGFHIIRFTNEEVLHHTSDVLLQIKLKVTSLQ